MLRYFLISLFLLTIGSDLFVPLVNASGHLTNSITTKCIWSPALILIYQVDRSSLQKYIDPRFTPAELNNSSYVVLVLTNASSTTSNGSTNQLTTFLTSSIYTIVQYQNETRRETLYYAVNNPVVAIVSQPVAVIPYGSVYADYTSLSLNNQTQTFSFDTIFKAKNASIYVTVNFNRNQTVNVGDPTSSVPGFVLSEANNRNLVQTLYTKETPIEGQPIATGMIVDSFFTEVNQCNLINLESNYITQNIGPMNGLNDNRPMRCLFAPYGTVDVTPITYSPV